MNLFALLSQTSNIRRLWSLWNKNRAENTEMIDLARGIMGAIGVLDQLPPPDNNPVPAPLRQYSTQWIQETLNILDNAGLKVDGEIGDATRAAVKKFQAEHDLKVDGAPGVQTVAVLAAERARKEGSS